MPHVPDGAHDTHDVELVAAYAAGDAGGPDLDRAMALVASCAGCATLHRDLRSIATAVHDLPQPARPRDFRITPEQAATLRPRGVRGFLAALSGPRFALATPIGSGLAALGIVAVLVASGGGGPTVAPSTASYGVAAASDAAGSVGATSGAAASVAPQAIEAGPAGAAPVNDTSASAAPAPNLKAAADGTAAGPAPAPVESLPAPDAAPGPNPLGALGLLLVFVGFALLGARAVGRRLNGSH